MGVSKRQKQWIIKQGEIELKTNKQKKKHQQREIEDMHNEKVFLPDFLLEKINHYPAV